MTDNLKRFITHTGWAFASLAVAAIVQFIVRIFLARYYGAGDLGLYTLAFTAYSFGLIFSGFGIGSGLLKYVAEAGENLPRIHLIVISGITTSFLSGCIMGLILYFASPYISTYFFKMPELTVLFQIVSFAFPFIALEKAVLGFLNGIRRMRLFAFINIIQYFMVVILTFIFALKGYDIKYAIMALIFPVVLMSLLSLFYVRKSLLRFQIAECTPVVKMLLVFGFYAVLTRSMSTIMTYTDSTMLGYFLTDVDVGVYAVAVVLMQAVRLPPQAIQTITAPMIALYWGKNEIDKIGDLVDQCMKYTAFYAILISFVVGFLSQDFIGLFFGRDFLPASFPLQILLVGAVFGAIQTSIGSALSSTAYIKLLYRITGVTALLNVGMNILLIPHFGISGAALATSMIMTLSALIQLYFTQRLIRIRIDWLWFVKLFGSTILIAAGAYGIGQILNLYLCTLLALFILIAVILRFFVTSADRKRIREILHLSTRG